MRAGSLFSIARRRIAVLLCGFAFLAASACFAAASPTFESANQLYSQGQFEEACRQYEELAKTGPASANLYYNLGNAEYRLGARGRAILDYERALILEPAHPEARANLTLAREQSGSRLMPAPWFDRLALRLTAETYVVAAAASVWMILSLCLWLQFWRRTEGSGPWFVLLLAVCAGAYSGFVLWNDWQDRSAGIVTARGAVARLANAASAGPVEDLTEGSRVGILSERDGWVYCDLPGRERGWLPADAVTRVRGGS